MLRWLTGCVVALSAASACFAQLDASTVTGANWVRENAVAIEELDPAVRGDDQSALIAFVGDARVVGIGQATYGSREQVRYTHRAIRALVEQHGFTVIALDAPMLQTLELNSYVFNGQGDPARMVFGLGVWFWSTEETLELVEWVRAHNEREADPAKRVRFIGIDMELVSGPARVMRSILQALSPELIEAHAALFAEAALAPNSRGNAALAPIAAALLGEAEAKEPEWAAQIGASRAKLAVQVARVLAQGHELVAAGNDATAVRERAFADNLYWVTQYFENEKVVFCGHNLRVCKLEPWSGHHIAAQFGDGFVSVGQVVSSGAFAAVDELGMLRAFPVARAVDRSFDAVFPRAGMGPMLADLRMTPEEGLTSQFARDVRPFRVVETRGLLGNDQFARFPAAEGFDLVAYIGASSPTRPVRSAIGAPQRPLPTPVDATPTDAPVPARITPRVTPTVTPNPTPSEPEGPVQDPDGPK